MSGHSKWATTKHKKAAIDAKRGKLFAKLIKNIEVAARTGGGDPAGNPTSTTPSRRRRRARSPTTTSTTPSSAARAHSRRRGLGEHHARGLRARRCRHPHRVPHRQPQPGGGRGLRTALTRNGGQLADPGSVAYVFDRKGVVVVLKGEKTEDDILEIVLDAGADEVNDLGESFEIISEATDFVAVRKAVQDAGIDYDSAEAPGPEPPGPSGRRGAR